MMIPPGPAGPPSGPFPVVDPGPPSGQFPVVQPGPPTGQFPVPELAPRQLAGPPSGFGDPVGMGPDERLGLRGGDGGGRTGQGDAAGKKKKKRRRPSVPGTNEFPAIRLPDEPGVGDYDMYR